MNRERLQRRNRKHHEKLEAIHDRLIEWALLWKIDKKMFGKIVGQNNDERINRRVSAHDGLESDASALDEMLMLG